MFNTVAPTTGMRNFITILDKNTGKPKTGYTVKLYKYSSDHSTSNFYSSSSGLLGTLTDQGDGNYYIDLSTDVRGVLVITTPSTTAVIIPNNYVGRIFDGENKLTIPPPS